MLFTAKCHFCVIVKSYCRKCSHIFWGTRCM